MADARLKLVNNAVPATLFILDSRRLRQRKACETLLETRATWSPDENARGRDSSYLNREDKKEIEAGEFLGTHKSKLRYEDSREKKKLRRDGDPKLLEKEEEKKKKRRRKKKLINV